MIAPLIQFLCVRIFIDLNDNLPLLDGSLYNFLLFTYFIP